MNELPELPTAKKDPKRQLLGLRSKEKGKLFEKRIDRSLEYFKVNGIAAIEKTPEPMKPIRPLSNGQYIACYERKGQPDYKGVIKGGREIVFEAKYTDTDEMKQNRVEEHQAEFLNRHQALGARCFVIAGFGSGRVYKIPWTVWDGMKEHFGRKYVKETELEVFAVPTIHGGYLDLFCERKHNV